MYSKVKYQFEHSLEINDNICKFNSLWISFNCFYNIKINRGTDRQKIEKIKNNAQIKQIFLGINKDIKNDFYEFINGRKNKGVKKMDNSDRIISYLCINCFGEFLEIIYTIRNNQFHGGKDWSKEEEILLLSKSNKIFEIFLKELYEFYSIL